MKLIESLKAAWNDNFNQELESIPQSSPLKIVFPFDFKLKTYSSKNFKDFSTSKLISNDDVDTVLKLVKEGHSHLNPMNIKLKRCVLISEIITINILTLVLILLFSFFKNSYPSILLLIIIFVFALFLTFTIQIIMGNYWKKLDRKRTDDMVYNVEKALDFHNRKMFNRLGYAWQLSEHGAFISLSLTLHRLHGANSAGKLLMGPIAGEEDLSVIREESTLRSSNTTALNSEVRKVGVTTGRMTGAIKEVDDIEEQDDEEEEKEVEDDVGFKAEEKKLDGDINGDDGGRGNWDDFGDVLMSTDRKFNK